MQNLPFEIQSEASQKARRNSRFDFDIEKKLSLPLAATESDAWHTARSSFA